MAVNIGSKDRQKNANLRNVADRPLLIEVHGVQDQKAERLLSTARSRLENIKNDSLSDLLESLINAVTTIREDKSSFDNIRRNIDTLWKRKETGAEGAAGTAGASPKVVQPVGGTLPPSSQTDQIFYAYDELGQIVLGLSETVLTLDTEVKKDASYLHGINSEEIEISTGGDFEIDINASFGLNETDSVELKLQIDIGAGWVDVPGSKSYCGV